jgi:hypothetical protein
MPADTPCAGQGPAGLALDPGESTDRMPQTLRMLRWLYMGRLTLATGIFTGALGAWTRASSGTTLIATLGLLAALAVTMFGLWWTEWGRAPAPAGGL